MISGLVFNQLPIQDITLLVSSTLTSLTPTALIKLGAFVSGSIILASLGWFARQARLL